MRHAISSAKVLGLVVVGSALLAHQAARADFVFGEPTKVPNINSSSDEASPFITSNGLMLYFNSNRDHGSDLCYTDIWLATRATRDEPWGTPTIIGPPVNTPGPEGNCCISADGLELYFAELWPPLFLSSGCQPRSDCFGYGDIWVSARETTEDHWGEPVNLGPAVNSSAYEDTPHITADGLTLYFSRAPEASFAGGGLKLYVTTRLSKDNPWNPAVELGPPINTAAPFVSCPFTTSDDLSLIFMGAPLDHTCKGDIYLSRRATASDPWGQPMRLSSINTPLNEESLTFATGDSTLYFTRGDPYNPNRMPDPALATYDIWQVEVTPLVDFDSDETVTLTDLRILIDNWGTRQTLYDIGPMPLGDGKVDIEDLKVFIRYWEKENEADSQDSP